MSVRLLQGVPDSALAEVQEAARKLLLHGIITARYPDDETLPLVRRWLPALQEALSQLAGYRILHNLSAVRLLRRRDWLSPLPFSAALARPFDRRRLTLLILALAALESCKEQVTLGELSSRLASLALEVPGLGFDPNQHVHRRHFCDVLHLLVRLGALRLADGDLDAWAGDPQTGEALYDVDRDVLFLLFHPPAPIGEGASVSALLAQPTRQGRDGGRLEARQRLIRLILERPVLYYADLGPRDRRHLQTEAGELAADLARLVGAHLERRAEGVALIDTTAEGRGGRFPGSGTVPQVGLLLVDRMCAARDQQTLRLPGTAERSRALALAMGDSGPQGDPESDTELELPFFPNAWIDRVMAELIGRHGRGFAAEHRADPGRLTGLTLDLLESWELIRQVRGGALALPAMARYRDVALKQRNVTTDAQASLFGGARP